MRETNMLCVDDDSPSLSSGLRQCRICYEEDDSSTSMESPCACSGTLKFAHRECIQRWCHEKGSTVCEICLQNFEPNYVVPLKLARRQAASRDSHDIPELMELNEEEDDEDRAAAETELRAFAAAAEKGFSYCRSATVMLTVFLLARHLLAVLSLGADEYAFTIAVAFLLRASGILLPLYLLLQLISTFQHALRRHHVQDSGGGTSPPTSHGVVGDEGGDERLHQHIVDIAS